MKFIKKKGEKGINQYKE